MATSPTPRQLTALANGATRFTVPMDPQPPKGSRLWGDPLPDYDFNCMVQLWTTHPTQGDKGETCETRIPYRPGDRIPLREEWAFYCTSESGTLSDYHYFVWIEYLGDEVVECEVHEDVYRLCKAFFEAEDGDDTAWRPASEMPDWAVRKWATVLSCEPCRVGEISEGEAMDEGFMGWDCDVSGGRNATELLYAAWESDFPGVPFESWGWCVRVESK